MEAEAEVDVQRVRHKCTVDRTDVDKDKGHLLTAHMLKMVIESQEATLVGARGILLPTKNEIRKHDLPIFSVRSELRKRVAQDVKQRLQVVPSVVTYRFFPRSKRNISIDRNSRVPFLRVNAKLAV